MLGFSVEEVGSGVTDRVYLSFHKRLSWWVGPENPSFRASWDKVVAGGGGEILLGVL